MRSERGLNECIAVGSMWVTLDVVSTRKAVASKAQGAIVIVMLLLAYFLRIVQLIEQYCFGVGMSVLCVHIRDAVLVSCLSSQSV